MVVAVGVGFVDVDLIGRVVVVECCCFLLLIIIDEGAGDATVRFVLLKPGLSEAVFKLLL